MFGIALKERLSATVGDGRENKEDDVIRVKDRLDDMGYTKASQKTRKGVFRNSAKKTCHFEQ